MTRSFLRVRGQVVHGDGRGRELGFPTANVDATCELPPAGVYAAWARGVPGTQSCLPAWHPATVSVGDNPTFGDVAVERFECFLHDFSGDLYGQQLEIAIVAYIRGMVAFSGPEELVEWATRDVARSRELLRAQLHPSEVS